MIKFFCFISLFFFSSAASEKACSPDSLKILFIYGTSCAGKSSLSKQLIQCLGNQWQLIDRDAVIEEQQASYLQTYSHLTKEQIRHGLDEIEASADDIVLQKIHESLQNHLSVIVDTQLHQNLLDCLQGFLSYSVLVYAPLLVLLERDEQRSLRLKRSERRKFYAKAFILETFAQLFSLENTHEHTEPVDVLSFSECNPDILQYCLHPKTYSLFDYLCHHSDPVLLWSKEPFDLIINSQLQSLQEAKELTIHIIDKPKKY